MITARILPGSLNAYNQAGGSWNEAEPDPNSFTMELAGIPPRGSWLMYTNDEGGNTIAQVDDVVFNRANVYLFVTIVQR